jgi:uncharacterized membrane protein YkgB
MLRSRQTTGRSLVLTGIGIVLAGVTISALRTWNPNKAVWEDWLLVAGPWLVTIGFWSLFAYVAWVDVKPRQHWFPAVAAGVLMVSSILFFTLAPTIADPLLSR